MKWVKRKLPTELGSLPSESLFSIGLTLYSEDHMTINPKLQLCKQHFPLEALSINNQQNIVPTKEDAVGTPAILDLFVSSESIEELVRVTDLKFGRGVGNTVSNNKF